MAALKWDLIALIALLSFTMGSSYRIQGFNYDTPATKPRTLDEITDNPDLASVRHTHGRDAVSKGSYFGGSGGGGGGGGSAPGFGGGYGQGGGNSGGGGGGVGWSGGGVPSYGAPGFGGNNGGGGCGYGGGYGDGGHATPGGMPPIQGMPRTGGPFYCQPSSCGDSIGHDCPGFTMHLTHHAPAARNIMNGAEDDSLGKIRDATAPESG